MTKSILAGLLIALTATVAVADPITSARDTQPAAAAASVQLQVARDRVAETRRQWDLAVAGGHPVAAGHWAMRHYDAMQAQRVAYEQWRAAGEHTSRRVVAGR